MDCEGRSGVEGEERRNRQSPPSAAAVAGWFVSEETRLDQQFYQETLETFSEIDLFIFLSLSAQNLLLDSGKQRTKRRLLPPTHV